MSSSEGVGGREEWTGRDGHWCGGDIQAGGKWSGDVLNWIVRGEDGLTSYQRVRGKPFTTRLVCLGERVRYKLRSHEPLARTPQP